MSIEISNESGFPIDESKVLAVARHSLDEMGVNPMAELSLLLVDVEYMAELNHRWMGKTGPTDVLAFPIDDPVVAGRWPDSGSAGPDRDEPEPGDLPLLLGDVVVCPKVAERQAPEHAGSYEDEMALLVVHGVLHVLGHDHAEPDETAVMQAREQVLLDRFHHRR